MEIDQLGRLQNILEACRLIESYVAGVSNDAFSEDTEKQDAVVRRIEIIGEATAHLSDTTRALLPPCRSGKCAAWRNIVAHDYGHVDVALVWKAAIENIPAIRRALADFLGEKR